MAKALRRSSRARRHRHPHHRERIATAARDDVDFELVEYDRFRPDRAAVHRSLLVEESLGDVLFERSNGRWRLTAFGRGAVERAAHIEEDVAGILRSAECESQVASGVVRLTSPPTTHSEYLVHRLPNLCARHPDLVIDLVDSDANLDITRHVVADWLVDRFTADAHLFDGGAWAEKGLPTEKS